MDSHKNAPMTPAGRLRLVEAVREGCSVKEASQAFRIDRNVNHLCLRDAQLRRVEGKIDRRGKQRDN